MEIVVWSALHETVAGTLPSPQPLEKTPTVAPFRLPTSIALLNCMVNTEFTGTLVCPFCTLALITEDGVKSGCAAVVKFVFVLATDLPATLVTPLIVTVICVLGGRGAKGVMETR